MARPPIALGYPKVHEVFEQLLEVVHQAETDVALFDLP